MQNPMVKIPGGCEEVPLTWVGWSVYPSPYFCCGGAVRVGGDTGPGLWSPLHKGRRKPGCTPTPATSWL